MPDADDNKRACASCVPLSNFGGHVPRGFLVSECANLECKRAIIITPKTLKAVPKELCFCQRCAALIAAVQLANGVPFEHVKLPGISDPDSPTSRAIASGEMTPNPDSIIHRVREIDPKELGLDSLD